MLDAVESDLRRYERQQDQLERRGEAIDAAAEKLLKPGATHYPFSDDNFIDAISAMSANDPGAFSVVVAALAAGEFAFAGKELAEILQKHQAQLAQEEAELDIDGECDRCFGKGCRRCDPPERDPFDD